MLDLVIAMIVARLIAPASKLATARILDPATAASSLGDVLGLGAVDEDELYAVLYDETDHEGAATMRVSIVAKAERSEAAICKQTTGRTDDGLPVHSFQTLLADLATYSRIQATTALNEKHVFTLHTRPTPIQQRAFELLGINPDRTQ